jgi:hypothetical protein
MGWDLDTVEGSVHPFCGFGEFLRPLAFASSLFSGLGFPQLGIGLVLFW